MKKIDLLKCMATIFFSVGILSSPQPLSSQTVDECSKELLLAYFPEAFVNETLKKFNVPQGEWEAIKKELSSKDKDVIKIVEQKASQMNPNPLKDPQQRQAAVKIFRETLLQIFGDVMRAHGINDQQQIQSMLDDVQQQKAKRFAKCMEKRADNDDDEDEDDDDDEDNTNKPDNGSKVKS